MTKHIKYRVKIPITNNDKVEYVERNFIDKKDVCEFLEISECTFSFIVNGTLKFKKIEHKHLEGYIIEKIALGTVKKTKKEPIDPLEFKNRLLNKNL